MASEPTRRVEPPTRSLEPPPSLAGIAPTLARKQLVPAVQAALIVVTQKTSVPLGRPDIDSRHVQVPKDTAGAPLDIGVIVTPSADPAPESRP